jgi:hypothetical protein
MRCSEPAPRPRRRLVGKLLTALELCNEEPSGWSTGQNGDFRRGRRGTILPVHRPIHATSEAGLPKFPVLTLSLNVKAGFRFAVRSELAGDSAGRAGGLRAVRLGGRARAGRALDRQARASGSPVRRFGLARQAFRARPSGVSGSPVRRLLARPSGVCYTRVGAGKNMVAHAAGSRGPGPTHKNQETGSRWPMRRTCASG